MNRTQEQIVERLRTQKERDFFGFGMNDLIVWLDYEHAKEFLRPEATADEWAKNDPPKPVREQMTQYMPFAWEKANDCRGLSAGRSLKHFEAWLWLLGEDALADEVGGDYEHYGKAHLTKVCEFLGVDAKQWDNGRRVNSEDDE